jgi:hypothetical protein
MALSLLSERLIGRMNPLTSHPNQPHPDTPPGLPPIDPDQFRLNPGPGQVPERKVELATTARRRKSRFIPPIPLEWFARACRLPGKAAALAAAIWYLFRRQGSGTVHLTQTSLEEFGISRQAKYRGLRSLEQAGLIAVQRHARKNPEVTILTPL